MDKKGSNIIHVWNVSFWRTWFSTMDYNWVYLSNFLQLSAKLNVNFIFFFVVEIAIEYFMVLR